jgi:hypothetical protein
MNPVPAAPPARLALLLALVACTGAAFWIANGVAPWDADRTNVWHHYEYMTEGFLHGHTYLSLEPAAELARLKDPYDPAENAPYRLWDASYYQGKYFLYYGPAPAIAVMLPWRILTGHMLPQRLAVAVFAAAGMAGLGLLLSGVRRRCFPRLSGVALGGIALVAFHASWLPVVLRRPSVWELPIVSAVAWLWWGLYFLWKFHDSGGRARWAAALGIALAFLMGSRATYVFAAGAMVALALVPAAGLFSGPRTFRGSGLAAAALAFAGGIALLVYNHERFGRWLEFGQSYQLWGADERNVAHFSLSYAPFNVWTYLFSLPSFGPYFPFLHPYWAGSFPSGYIAFEEVYGVLFMMPVHIAGLAGLTWAWLNRRSAQAGATRIVVLAAGIASVLSFLCLVCWAGACSRYIAELMAGWTVVTSVGLMVAFTPSEAPRPRFADKAILAAMSCWTVACVWLASAEFRGFMRQTNPATYRLAAHTLDYPSAWWAQKNAVPYGPVELDVSVPPGSPAEETVLLASGRPQRANQLVLDVDGDGGLRLTLADNQHPVLVTPVLHAVGNALHLRVDAPWLYPPRESPYWDRINDPVTRADLQQLFAVKWDGGGVSARSPLSNDATAYRPTMRTKSDAGSGSPFVAAMRPAGVAP